MGAAWSEVRGAGIAGEGTRAHLGTCPTMRGHLAYPGLAILICPMGIATPVTARGGGGSVFGKEGAELVEGAWMDGWMDDVRKSPDREG